MVVIIIMALFADKLPAMARWQLSTTAGRLLLLLLLYIIHMICGWPMALLFTIAIALVWAARPIFKTPSATSEGFNDMKKTDATKHKWFIEKTLHENPKAIVEDRINTSAVEEDTVVATGRTSK